MDEIMSMKAVVTSAGKELNRRRWKLAMAGWTGRFAVLIRSAETAIWNYGSRHREGQTWVLLSDTPSGPAPALRIVPERARRQLADFRDLGVRVEVIAAELVVPERVANLASRPGVSIHWPEAA